MSKISLKKRLLIVATLTLVAFLGLAGVALDQAFIASAKVALKKQLQSQVTVLLTVVEFDHEGNITLPAQLPESRLASPVSQLYAFILDKDGRLLWRSKSSVGFELDYKPLSKPGDGHLIQFDDNLDSPFYYSFGIDWEINDQRNVRFTVLIVDESGQDYKQVIHAHRSKLILWLGLAGVLLLIIQTVAVHLSLVPLSRVTAELGLIEHGRQPRILGQYPKEIAQLSQRINLFIDNERKSLEKNRHMLADLAHSLKTPLAVIKGLVEKRQKVDLTVIDEHIDRMDSIVEHQLKKATTVQYSLLHSFVDIHAIMKKIDASLQKIYADKSIETNWDIAEGSIYYGDENDLYELLGNIMENAYKWAAHTVNYRTAVLTDPGQIHNGLRIEVSDDGPGIGESQWHSLLERGGRADQQVPGQGIGLAISKEIIQRYNGQFECAQSKQAGTLISMTLPPT